MGRGAGAGATGGGAARIGMAGVGALPKFIGTGVGEPGVNSSPLAPAPSRNTVITPPQTAQRARTMGPDTLAGSTRNTERHSGQETFT